MSYNFKQVLLRLTEKGWIIKARRGSHVQLVHPNLPGKVTVPDHGKKDIKPGTLKSIWKQAGLI